MFYSDVLNALRHLDRPPGIASLGPVFLVGSRRPGFSGYLHRSHRAASGVFLAYVCSGCSVLCLLACVIRFRPHPHLDTKEIPEKTREATRACSANYGRITRAWIRPSYCRALGAAERAVHLPHLPGKSRPWVMDLTGARPCGIIRPADHGQERAAVANAEDPTSCLIGCRGVAT